MSYYLIIYNLDDAPHIEWVIYSHNKNPLYYSYGRKFLRGRPIESLDLYAGLTHSFLVELETLEVNDNLEGMYRMIYGDDRYINTMLGILKNNNFTYLGEYYGS